MKASNPLLSEQVFPNISRFLIRWGVDKIIGSNLVAHEECNTYYGRDAELIAYSDPKRLVKNTGFPCWLVRRDHLHAGLVESAKQHGVNMIVDTRISKIDDSAEGVHLETTTGQTYDFDLVIGADCIKSFVRQTLFPGVVPKAPSKQAAYRGVLTYEEIFAEVPEARTYLRNTMDIFLGPRGYILTYPMSGGKDCNIVTAFCKDVYCTTMEEVDVDEFRDYYKDFSVVIQKVIKLVNYTQRWPLLQMPRMERWSNSKQNIVLLGDAVHCMQNAMAQGAATAIEDGAFLGVVLSEVIRGVITLPEAVTIYEKQRMPRAWTKQQISYQSGLVNTTPDRIEERNAASKAEADAKIRNPIDPAPLPSSYRSWQYAFNFSSVPGVFTYDAEGDADNVVCEYLQSRGGSDESGMVSEALKSKWWGYVSDNGLGGVNSKETNGGLDARTVVTKVDYETHSMGL